MIISQTPLRVSFLGGGTDYPEHFLEHGGAVLGTAINKSAFLCVSKFYSELFDYSIRISYRQVECVRSIEEIDHKPFKECLRWCGIDQDVELDYMAELPAYTGLGSSSTFIVGLLNSLYAFKGQLLSPIELAYQAIEIERNVLGESVGCQDQALTAIGGLNMLEFKKLDEIVVYPISLNKDYLHQVESHLLLLFTGTKRKASSVALKQIGQIKQNKNTLCSLRSLVDKGYDIFLDQKPVSALGELLHESWLIKRGLHASISNPDVDEAYTQALNAGALGGKLLGAGGGGFLLFVVPPEKRKLVRASLSHLIEIPVSVAAPGTRIVHGWNPSLDATKSTTGDYPPYA